MQSGQNPFDKGRNGNEVGVSQLDRTGPPPPPPTYQQHFQTVRFGTAPSPMPSLQFGHNANTSSSSSIFGSPAVASVPISTGRPPMTTATSGTGTSIFGGSAFQMTTPAIFGGIGTTAAASASNPNSCIFPAGAAPTPSKFRFVASRLGPPSASMATTTPTTVSTPSSNVFEKRFGGSGPTMTSIANIFGKVEPRSPDAVKAASVPTTEPIVRESGAGRKESVPAGRPSAKKPLVRRSGLQAAESSAHSGPTRSSFRGQNALAGTGTSIRTAVDRSTSGSRRSRLLSKDTSDKLHHHHPSEPRTRRLSERSGRERTKSEDAVQRTAIVLKGVPARLNNKRFLLERFGRYGIVQRINCMVRQEMSVVHFTDHESAKKAKENGAELEPGTSPVLVLLSRMPTPAARSSRSLLAVATGEALSSKSVSRRPGTTEPASKGRRPSPLPQLQQQPQPASEPQFPFGNDDEDAVRAELKTMSQGGALTAATVLQRPREIAAAAAQDTQSTHLSPKHGSPAKPTRRSSPHPPPPAAPASSASQMPQLVADGCDCIQALSNTQASNAAEKFQVLVARDKFIRQGTKKPADLASARAAVGTCPDMCPEKERYMREDRGQLHPYEILSGSGGDEKSGELPRVDHRRAIKEYSRSSADQEEPLPHELRPPDVLQRTMDYLVCNVLDLLDDVRPPATAAAAEWYDFVWNRTRGIRKDITQQHLCDRTSVALAEKCTRFHIHCAERLCEEDMSIFDQKINNENLTKCLQTLKHLYADLALKGERCANEAEFRAYDILLNLNEGDTLREVLCLPPDVRRSNEVRFALRLFADVNSNNYVAFFRHARAAPYLVACILQRYFTQVRERALKVILKAYCAPNHAGQFPIGKFIEMLAFEDHGEARDFLGYHSLSVEYDYVVWDRAGLTYPESAVPTRRARLLIESKRQCSVGEVVNGGELPENPLYTYVPHSSFDVHGKLNDFCGMPTNTDVVSADIGSLQSAVTAPPKTTENTTKSLPITDDEQKRQLLRQSFNKAVEDEATGIAGQVTSTMIEDICRQSLDELQVNMAVITVASGLLTDVTRPIIRDVAEGMIREFKTAELRMRLMREEAELKRQHQVMQTIMAKAIDDVLNEVVGQETRAIASSVLRNELQKRWQRDCQQCSEWLATEYTHRWTLQFTVDIVSQVHHEEAEHRRSTLTRVSQKIDGWRALTFCNKWRQLVARRKRTRQSMATFPSSACLALGSRIRWTAQPLKPAQLQSPVQIASDQTYNKCLLDIGVCRKHLESRLKEKRLDLQRIATNRSAGAGVLQGSYWKVAVLIGSDDGTSDFSEWVRLKLSCSRSPTSSSRSPSPSASGAEAKAFCGQFDDPRARAALRNSKELQGSRGMVMVLSTASSFTKSYWANEYQRLIAILDCMPPRPTIPILVLCPWLMTQSDESGGGIVESELHLKSLVRDGHIKAYRIATNVGDMKEPEASVHLVAHLEWLVRQCPTMPNLKSMPLEAFVDDCITRFFSSVVCRTTRHGAANLHPPPDLLVSRYNDAIRFAADIASSSTLKDVSWPPLELSKEFLGSQPNLLSIDWNDDETLARLRHLVERYSLPPLPLDIIECTTFDQLSHAIRIYTDAGVLASETLKIKGSKAVLTARIQQIVDRASQLHRSTLSNLRPADVVPWIEVIQATVDHVFCCLAEVQVSVTVVYDPGLAGLFTGHKEWDMAADRAMAAAADRLKATRPTSDATVDSIRRDDPRQEHGLKRKRHKDPFAEASPKDQVHLACRRLSQHLAAERRKNAQYESYLKELLTGNLMMPLKLLDPTSNH